MDSPVWRFDSSSTGFCVFFLISAYHKTQFKVIDGTYKQMLLKSFLQYYRGGVVKHLLPLLLLTGCTTISTLPPLDYRPGAVVDTLSSAVSLSVNATDRSMSGNGYMVFRRPDQLHLMILSPFGTTIMEAFSLGERIVLVYPSQSTAYSGRFDELPDKGGLQGWRLMRWVMDADPSDNKLQNGTMERLNKLGFKEKVVFENGLLTAKTSPDGDKVYYGKYSVVNGVPIAAEVELHSARDESIRMTMDEPEVNTLLDASAFMPRLDGMTVLPLSAIQGL